MKNKIFTTLFATAIIIAATSCNKVKKYTKRINGEKWTVTELSVDAVAEAELPTAIEFGDCNPYKEQCNGEWLRDEHHAEFAYQFREKGKKFELSNQTSADHSHGGGHEEEENTQQCIDFSGVYDVIKAGKDEMEFKSTTTVGYPGQTVLLKLKKQ